MKKHIFLTLALLLVIPIQTLQAVTVLPSGAFGYTEGTLAGLSGVNFNASFNYDTSNVTGAFNFGPNLSVYGLGAPASVDLTVTGEPGLSFSTNDLGVWVENDHFFDGFDWIPAGLSDFLWITGMAPGTLFDLATNSITDGITVSLTYAGDAGLLPDTSLPPDLTSLNFNSLYNPGFFVVLDEYRNGQIVGSAFWNLGNLKPVPEAPGIILLLVCLLGMTILKSGSRSVF